MDEPETKVRWLIRRDMEEVLDIERLCFPDHPWSEEDFLSVLRQRNCIGMVAERGTRVVGFQIYELEAGMLRLSNLAVHPFYQREGVGTQLVERLKDKLSQARRREIRLRVSDTNVVAQLFFKAAGFSAIGVEREAYENGQDAYTFAHHVGGPRMLRTFWEGTRR